MAIQAKDTWSLSIEKRYRIGMRPTLLTPAVVVLLAVLPACGDDTGLTSGLGGSAASSADGSSSTGSPSSSSSSSPTTVGPGGGGSSSDGGGGSTATTGETTSSATGGGGGGGAGGSDVCAGPRPGPTNTGVPGGIELVPSGSITIDEDGAIIEGLDIEGEVTILADDVTIRNCRIRSGDYYPIRYFDEGNTGLVVEDSEIEGLSEAVTAAISFTDYTARRLNVHGGADGFKADANVLIEDCWVHDLGNYPDQHNDGVQSTGGKGVTIRHSDLSGGSNAAVQTGDEGAATEDLLIECSWLSGGGYTLNIRGSGATVPVHTRILNNRFGRNAAYGPLTIDDPNPIVTGNVYDDDDEPIPYP